MGTYFSRLGAKVWFETKDIWTSYRWWLSIASPAAAVLVLAYRKGWSAIMNAQDVIINGAAGAAIAFVGSLAISLLRSPVLLDDERSNEISKLNERIQTLSKKPYDEDLENAIQGELGRASDVQNGVLTFLLLHGETEGRRIVPVGHNIRGEQAAQECCEMDLVDRREDRPGNGLVVMAVYYKVKDSFRTVLKDLLYPRTPDDRKEQG